MFFGLREHLSSAAIRLNVGVKGIFGIASFIVGTTRTANIMKHVINFNTVKTASEPRQISGDSCRHAHCGIVSKLKNIIICAALSALMIMMLTACGGEDKYALRDQGIELYRSGDYAAAVESFDKAMDASDGQVSELQYDILKYRGECEIRLGDYSAAKESYNALYELCKDSPDYADIERIHAELSLLDELESAVELMKLGSYDRAYDKLKSLDADEGTFTGAAAMFNMAVCDEYLGNFDEAYELFSRYLEQYPDDAKAGKEAEFCRTRKLQ